MDRFDITSWPPPASIAASPAILAADVVGYARLIEREEAGTLERLKEHRKSFIEPR